MFARQHWILLHEYSQKDMQIMMCVYSSVAIQPQAQTFLRALPPNDMGSTSLNVLISWRKYRYMTIHKLFNNGINAWKLDVTFSSPFIALKPPNNRNKLCVFFFIITRRLIFLYILRSNRVQTINVFCTFLFVVRYTTFASAQAALESIIFSSLIFASWNKHE